MQLKRIFSKWTQVAGLLLMGGALAWAIKLCVIIATAGRVIDTGAAALFMKIGLVLLLIGSTGVGYRFSYQRAVWLRVLSIILSPVVVFGSLILIGSFIVPLFKNSGVWYAEQEAPIALAVIVCTLIGYLLYKNYQSAAVSYTPQAVPQKQ